jgi:predicted dithiol-disulfide oxidoreductase (DUF899 family)
MDLPDVVSRDEWVVARRRLLVQEKEFTRARDRLNAERRRLPMVRIDEEVCLRGTGRRGDTARPVRGAPPAHRLPLPVRSELGRRLTDLLNRTFNYLDLTALRRQEPWEEPPGHSRPPASGWWWRRHDGYEQETNDSGDTT